ncbi:DinB family protein [Altibacter sp. HG106]|uniref:DinB family protein n=1 Tax=Altibacter sp. HG106 TaxID=3023937 RepID=UPI002350902A|nr:DinB family protein [Altibacter sp. HG106]MDC7996373.1 DinB family protein [Altibacter sp. HG106]
MKEFFEDIFEYHNHFNQKLIEQLAENENAITKRTIPLLSHSINAQQIWNARITNDQTLGVHENHTLKQCKRIDNENYNRTLNIIAERELNEIIIYANSKGTEFRNSIQQILFHIANHFSHHKGQIISDLRQSGINPIVTDYIFYKR